MEYKDYQDQVWGGLGARNSISACALDILLVATGSGESRNSSRKATIDDSCCTIRSKAAGITESPRSTTNESMNLHECKHLCENENDCAAIEFLESKKKCYRYNSTCILAAEVARTRHHDSVIMKLVRTTLPKRAKRRFRTW